MDIMKSFYNFSTKFCMFITLSILKPEYGKIFSDRIMLLPSKMSNTITDFWIILKNILEMEAASPLLLGAAL
jgi:hypothetical protein